MGSGVDLKEERFSNPSALKFVVLRIFHGEVRLIFKGERFLNRSALKFFDAEAFLGVESLVIGKSDFDYGIVILLAQGKELFFRS